MNPSEKLIIMALLYIIEGQEPHSTDYYELMRGLNIKEPDKACDTLTKALRERLEDLNDYEQYIKESWRK